MSDLYEQDFYAWSTRQAELLRSGNLAAADIAHIAEEIESMGRSERRELESRLSVLLLHLLKWRFQTERRSRSWELSIDNSRFALQRHIADNPSLKAKIAESLAAAYYTARRDAAIETGLALETFPADCPWSFEQAMQETR